MCGRRESGWGQQQRVPASNWQVLQRTRLHLCPLCLEKLRTVLVPGRRWGCGRIVATVRGGPWLSGKRSG